MSEEPGSEIGRFSKHKFIIMIAVSIVIALALASISMVMYAWSGAAQVDLSRPGYQSVRKEAMSNQKYDGFSATGEIDSKVLQEFEEVYGKQADQVLGIDAFAGDVLSDTTLKIDDPETTP